MSGGGKKNNNQQVVGYRYFLGVHIALCHGPVDSIMEFIAGDRSASQSYAVTLTGVGTVLGSDVVHWTNSGGPRVGATIINANIPAGTVVQPDPSSLIIDNHIIATFAYLRDKNGNPVYATGTLSSPANTAQTYLLADTMNASGSLYINNPLLFGGDAREGGMQGWVDVLMGEDNQPRNAYLQQFQGANCPAYRGFTSLVFKSFFWTSGSPYIKPLWVRLRRILKGWQNDSVWYPAKATINTFDMNPAHIIYQCLTDGKWGMGYTPSDIDDASFTAAADALYAEGFGLSIVWSQQSTIQQFIKVILDHINGTIRMDLSTGKFVLKLIRADYVVGSLVQLDESNVTEFRSFQRAAYGDIANEVVVEHTDRDENVKSIAVQDLASIQSQGAVISTSRSYHGIRDAALAARVALRDLTLVSSPLAKVSLTTNRILWDKEVGDVFALHWADYGLAGVPFRIVNIDKGSYQDGRISVDAVEDIFGLPTDAYTTAPASQWDSALTEPAPVEAARAVEVPYWEIERGMSRANIAQLQPDYGFGVMLAVRGAAQFPFQYTLSESADDTTYTDVSTGHFCPTGLLSNTVNRIETLFTIQNAYDLEQVVLDGSGGYAYVDDECVAVVSVDSVSGQVQVRRGCLDTAPVEHVAGARMWFMVNNTAKDATERTNGEHVYYKPRPTTGKGTLQVAQATAVGLTMTNRASRPYLPGNFKINGLYFPASIAGPMTVTWSHRDRTQQTVNLVDFTQGSIGPEVGTVARIRLYNGATLLREKVGGNSFIYAAAEEAADGYVSPLRIVLDTVVYEAWNLLNANYSKELLNVSSQEATPTDIALNSTMSRAYIVGAAARVYQYDLNAPGDISSGVYHGVSLSVAIQENNPQCLAFSGDGKVMYVLGTQHASVQPYTLMTPWDIATSVVSGTLVGIDFNTDGTKMYLLNLATGTIDEYRLTTPWDATTVTYVTSSPSVFPQELSPSGGVLSKDGTKLFVIGANDTVYMYNLSSAWNIATASYSGVSKPVSAQTVTARDVAFSSNGLTMYVVGNGTYPIYIYTLTVAWDISTATYSSTNNDMAAIPGYPIGAAEMGELAFSVTAQDSDPRALAFSTDGRTMFVAGATSGKIFQYSLVQPWRVSTAVYSEISFSSNLVTLPVGLAFSTDGSKMFLQAANGKVREYALPIAWNVGSAKYTGRFADSAVQESNCRGIAFDTSGLNLIAIGAGATAYQYAMYAQGGLESWQKHDWSLNRTF